MVGGTNENLYQRPYQTMMSQDDDSNIFKSCNTGFGGTDLISNQKGQPHMSSANALVGAPSFQSNGQRG